ncbi:MAG: DUF4260 domain-containing protein [Pseudomonadales bacterium]
MFSNPITQRRLECAVVLFASFLVYYHMGFSWGLFAVLFFIPDLSLFAYLKGPKIGGTVYNLAHCFIGPILLGFFSLYSANPLLQAISLIWLAHAAFDRAIGWGLKYPDSFCNTDMGLKTLALDNKYLR